MPFSARRLAAPLPPLLLLLPPPAGRRAQLLHHVVPLQVVSQLAVVVPRAHLPRGRATGREEKDHQTLCSCRTDSLGQEWRRLLLRLVPQQHHPAAWQTERKGRQPAQEETAENGGTAAGRLTPEMTASLVERCSRRAIRSASSISRVP